MTRGGRAEALSQTRQPADTRARYGVGHDLQGPVRPYALAGVGLIKSHVELTAASLFTTDNNDVGWDVGGGLVITF